MTTSTEARPGSDVTLAAGSNGAGALRGYLSVSPTAGGPGVVVIQEWWGLVDHVRDVCDRLAREGFVALAPDLYRGEATGDPGEAQRLMMHLDLARASADLDRAVTTLLDHDAVEGARVGCIGFCMGGQLALHAGAQNRRIGAVVDCYGIHPNVRVDFAAMQAAVLGVFAENDDFVPSRAVHQLERELGAAGVRHHFETYLGVEHAFLNDSRPEVYDAATAREAWGDILAFLRAELGA